MTEIEDLERKRDAAEREFHYYEGMLFRAKLKEKAMSQEECSRISKLIGSKVKDAWKVGG